MGMAGGVELGGQGPSSHDSLDHYSPERHFLTHHALRIKGFARADTIADIVDLTVARAEKNLALLSQRGFAIFREARALWQLTPEGRSAHGHALAEDVKSVRLDLLAVHYGEFLVLNARFKELCGLWQLRDGRPNDHCDSRYDQSVVAQLSDLDRSAQAVVAAMSAVLPRLAPYSRRLDAARRSIEGGDRQMFTGVMCGSYHDIWMELHEDLILTQGIDRSVEGSC